MDLSKSYLERLFLDAACKGYLKAVCKVFLESDSKGHL